MRSQELSLSRLVSTGSIADSRGALIISSNIAMLGAMVAALSGMDLLKGGIPVWGPPALTGLLCAGSVTAAAIGAFPRISWGVNSIVFFGGVSRITSDAYQEKLHAITVGDYARDLAEQCHRVASLASLKFRCVRVASSLLTAAAVPWLFCLYSAHRLPIVA